MQKTKEEIVKQINSIIEDYIQPAVAGHGGFIQLEDFDIETGRVLVLLQGS